ncbi:MAG: sulfite exporter TauE/SafE family protein [Clostridiales bacterium]|nr:sulfite exporter TauE/SafE family protein [Clostridiales bacterium]MDE6617618.1 sulfite exporter TauE/SafE family protein [Clostridiales bacterium]
MTAQQIIIIVSFFGGIIGGMGMGGGTLLIPLLTLAAGLSQHLAQAVNLIAFIPMSVVALVIHKKNGYVTFGKTVHIVVLAAIGAVGGSFLAKYSGGYILRACYGAFLIALGVFQLGKTIKTAVENKKSQNSQSKRGRLIPPSIPNS